MVERAGNVQEEISGAFFSMVTFLKADNSTGGKAMGDFEAGSIAVRDALDVLLLAADVEQFTLEENTSLPPTVLTGAGTFVVTGGTWQGLMAQVDEVVVVGTIDTFIDTYILDEIQLQATPLIGSVTTLLFEPPAGTANAVVVPNGNDCASLAAEIAACDATLGTGTVVCRDDLAVTASADSLSFPMPDEGFAGPVTVAVSPGGAALPCGLATTTCGGPGAPSGLLACIDRARELIGYEPRVSFEDGLQRTIQWFRDNWDRIDSSTRFGPGASAAVREMTTEANQQAGP